MGGNASSQCDIPALGEGLAYTQVVCGDVHSLLLRSDGTAVSCGRNHEDQCNIPTLVEGKTYIQAGWRWQHMMVLQAYYEDFEMCVRQISGDVLCRMKVGIQERISRIQQWLAKEIAKKINMRSEDFDVVFGPVDEVDPMYQGKRVTSILRQEPSALVCSVFPKARKAVCGHRLLRDALHCDGPLRTFARVLPTPLSPQTNPQAGLLH